MSYSDRRSLTQLSLLRETDNDENFEFILNTRKILVINLYVQCFL